MLGLGAAALGRLRQGFVKSLCAPLHDRQQHTLLGAEVVVDRAGRDTRLLHEARDGRGLVASLGHDPFCCVEHGFARSLAAAVGNHIGSDSHSRMVEIGLDITKPSCSVRSNLLRGRAPA